MAIRAMQQYGAPETGDARQARASAGITADDASATPTDPYSHPTSFVSFGQTLGANAGAVNEGAKALGDKAKVAAGSARKTLGDDYAGFESGLSRGVGAGSVTGDYGGPDAYAPNDQTYAGFGAAETARDQLGSTAGIQTALGPGASMFSAALIHHAGGPAFHQIKQAESGLEGEIGAAQEKAQHEVHGARVQARQNHDALTNGPGYRTTYDAARDKIQREQGANYGGGENRAPTDEEIHAYENTGYDPYDLANNTEGAPVRIDQRNRGY